jgi:hypothetical protein
VGLLNAKAFSLLLNIYDAEKKNRLLFFSGNLKVPVGACCFVSACRTRSIFTKRGGEFSSQ